VNEWIAVIKLISAIWTAARDSRMEHDGNDALNFPVTKIDAAIALHSKSAFYSFAHSSDWDLNFTAFERIRNKR
jgi:hypothetical protein